MTTTPRSSFPLVSTPADRSDARDASLDDTIESSFPASDPPSSIPDPEPEPMAAAASTAEALVSSPIFWAALGALTISAVWLGFTWQSRRRDW
jgi:hypothetical protein